MTRGIKRIDEHTHVATEEVPIRIGLPSDPPSPEVLEEMRQVCAQSGAREVYWFWLGLRADSPHLALAFAPFEPEIAHRIGQAILPIWRHARPENHIFDMLPLNDSDLSQGIREHGRQLYRTAD
jgi:hypothetical protein